MALDDDDDFGGSDSDGNAIASDVAQALGLDGERIATEHFAFTDIDGPGLDWHVRSFHWVEGLSETYEIVLDILTEDLEADCDTLLGAKCAFELGRGELTRTAYGIIHRVDYIGITSDKQMVRVYVVPALGLLTQQIDTRMWQGATVIEILRDVLEPALGEYDRQIDLETKVKGTYNKRDYCVQYRESDLAFARRLMEEEGIAFYFESDDDARAEKVVLCDNNDDYADVALVMDDEVPIIADRPETADRESLRHFDWSQSEQINNIVTSAYNWKVPTSRDGGAHMRIDLHHDRSRELYHHDEQRQIVDDPDDEAFTGEAMPQREPMAGRSLELFTHATERGHGHGNVVGFATGFKFKLAEHLRLDLDGKKFLITRVLHRGDAPEVIRGDDATPSVRYQNTFECNREEHLFRPAIVTPKPRVYGPETAIVVGPEGEEIHTDKFGRIKVQFHWDRLQAADESASCWVRVAQTWAGPGWGTWFIPRIGMEVVVEFLEGNPDRPLVTGCVYNGSNALPYALPDEKTKSTIKSNSSIGGSGFNEFRFEDLKGDEEIFLHAEKDLNEVIKNNMTTSVGNDQTLTVGNDRTKTVKGHEIVEIHKDRTTLIKGSENLTIDGSLNMKVVGAAAKGKATDPGESGLTLDVTGAYNIIASQKFTVTCGSSKIVIDNSNIAISTSAKISLTVGGTSATLLTDKITLTSAEATVSGGSGALHLKDTADLKGTGTAKVHQAGGAFVKLTGNAEIKGAVAKLQADGQVLVKGGPVELEGGAVTIKGSAVDVTGGGASGSFSSGIVKLN